MKRNIELSNETVIDVAKDNRRIVLGGGCFWGVEAYFSQLPGVVRTFVGYANGNSVDTSYEEVCTGTTAHAEVVFVEYNPKIIDTKHILKYFFKIIDPTILNRQGNDVGTQYRTGIYTIDEIDEEIVREFVKDISKEYSDEIVVEVKPLENLAIAEEYHRDYLKKNPGGYCHITFETLPDKDAVLVEKNLWSDEYVKKSDEELRESLSMLQYDVTQNSGTEKPFTSEYDQNFKEGIYVDITTGQPLFQSADKFDAGCGWPSFSKPIEEDLLTEHIDTRHGRIRTEVKSERGDSHLGHVFNDGPEELGGLRYCINGAAIRFIAKEDMEEEGYGYLKKLF